MILEKLRRLLLDRDGRNGNFENEESDPSQHVQRPHRIKVTPLQRVRLLLGSAHPVAVELVNLSTGGAAFLKSGLQGEVAPGFFVQGALEFMDGEKAEVEIEVVHVTEELVGCRFAGELPSRAIERFFSTELTALSMTEIKPEMLKNEPEGQSRWFFNPTAGCDLFYVESHSVVLRFALSLFGNYFEWNGDSLQFGEVSPDPQSSERGGPAYKGSSLVSWKARTKAQIPPDRLELGSRFVSAVPGLPTHVRAQIAIQFVPTPADR